MIRSVPVVLSLLMLSLVGTLARAGERELKTVEAADAVVRQFASVPLHCIPLDLLNHAAGVAILPNVKKAGLLIDAKFGRGIVLVRLPDGNWSNPVFVTMEGVGIGGQAGVESTDLVLVFRTPRSLDRVLHGRGKVTLGGDIAVAAGPVGRDAQVATDARLKAEILSYSRSRGLFAGAALEGSALVVDFGANESFYDVHGGKAADVLAHHGIAAVEGLRRELARLTADLPIVPPPITFVGQPPLPQPLPPQPRRR